MSALAVDLPDEFLHCFRIDVRSDAGSTRRVTLIPPCQEPEITTGRPLRRQETVRPRPATADPRVWRGKLS
ncbi:hypothetical protein ACFWNU_33550, partial [Streptomyces sp. NPDC058427]|uniref:hypothetical protein n=1 Tax=Streptomyces sp. NPDC058427 TaxID=3346494 RepID=UPI00364EC28B